MAEVDLVAHTVPRQDGRAGCAAIPKSAGPVDFVMLSKHVSKTLPKYAQPLFIRLVDACVLHSILTRALSRFLD